VAVAAMTSLMPQSWWDRMDTIETYQQDSSAQGRLAAWSLAVKVANTRPLGGGFDFWSPDAYESYGVDYVKAQDAHSIYFEVLGEHGWPGLLLFLVLLLAAWRGASSLIHTSASQPHLEWEADLARMVQVSLVAYMVGGAFLGLAYFDLPYHLIGMIVIMREYARLTAERGLAHVRGSDANVEAPERFTSSAPHGVPAAESKGRVVR
jgi:putative inorganic carbon (HCO3(-)) transporter